jgi:RNA polymerase sigma-70 factor (ECF subfamily)
MDQLLTADAPPVGESCAQTRATSSKGSPGRSTGFRDMRRPTLERPGDRRSDSAAVLTRIQGDAEDDLAAQAIITRIHAGDDVAFAELYVRYFSRVERYLRIALKNRDDAQEATQDVFNKVMKNLQHYEHRSEPFARWLFRIVRNHALDLQKRQRRTEATDPRLLDRRDRDTAVEDDHDAATVGALIETLSADQQRVMTLMYVYDFGVAATAEALGKTPDAIRHLHMRALRAVKDTMPVESRRHRARMRPVLAPVVAICAAIAEYSDEVLTSTVALC